MMHVVIMFMCYGCYNMCKWCVYCVFMRWKALRCFFIWGLAPKMLRFQKLISF